MAMRRDRRGATVVEHAVVLPLFLFLVLSVLEGAWQVATAFALDHGARRAARWATLGAPSPRGGTPEDFVAHTVLTATGMPLDMSRLSVTATAYGSYGALAAGSGAKAGLGGPNDVVALAVSYESRFVTPLMRAVVPRASVTLRSVVVVQNEPYPAP